MDRNMAGLIGAVGALVATAPAQPVIAAPATTAMHVDSYADLLKPIPNALALLKSSTVTAPLQEDEGMVQQVQYQYHHHHHHHQYRRRVYHHHHHHYHHHHQAGRIIIR